MAVSREYKYIHSGPDRREWLFDRIRDPRESRNRIALSACAAAGRELRRTLLEFLKRCSVSDAWIEKDGILQWREQPRFDDG